MIPNSEQLHYECNKLLRRKSRIEISEEISRKLNNNDYKFKSCDYDNNVYINRPDEIDDINPFIKFILCLCTKIEK